MRSHASHDIRLALQSDVPVIQEIANDAYSMYIPRIGKKPFPMIDDYSEHVAHDSVYVLHAHETIIGYIVLIALPQHDLLLDNIAVRACLKGHGYGRALLMFAEAYAAKLGFARIVLYTNEAMTENQSLYLHFGFLESHRACEKGYSRIYYYKTLGA